MLKLILVTLFFSVISLSSLSAVNSSTHIESDSQKIIKSNEQPKSPQSDKNLNDQMMFEKFQKLNQPPEAAKEKAKDKNIILDIQTPHGTVMETKITNDTDIKSRESNHLEILNFDPDKSVNEPAAPTSNQPQNIQNQQPPPYNPQNVEQRPYEHPQVPEVRPIQPQQETRTSNQPEQKPNDVFINN